MKRASMDIGSNTVRLLLAKNSGNIWERVEILHEVTGLSRRFDPVTQTIHPEQMERTVAAVERFCKQAKAFGTPDVRMACTGITRKAGNTPDFLGEVFARTGQKPVVIPGKKEAALSAEGAMFKLQLSHTPFLLFDIGGQSTEIIVSDAKGRAKHIVSLDLGVVRLTETYFTKQGGTRAQIEKMREEIAEFIVPQAKVIADFDFSPALLAGTAGTPTSLAAMGQKLRQYSPELVEGYVLQQENLHLMIEQCVNVAPARLMEIFPSLEKGREDLILAGMLICDEMMRNFDFSELTVTEGGLLEGLVLASSFPVSAVSD
jgi:exopolyphosphatase/guanosine-5'-triphosphate,3'-diphosphate pyrophosphatase